MKDYNYYEFDIFHKFRYSHNNYHATKAQRHKEEKLIIFPHHQGKVFNCQFSIFINLVT